jgi:mannonate dehydratase
VLGSKPDGAVHTVDELSALRDRCQRHGISLDMMTEPYLRPTPIDESRHAAIMLGQSPDRDREIEKVQTLIRNCAKAGIPAIRYNLTILGYLRSGRVPGPGGATFTIWRLADVTPLRNKVTRAGKVSADTFWERITYFLDRVIPVANEQKVRMACHPHDPPTPPGFQGVDAVHRRGAEEVRRHPREPLPRPELLPGHHRLDAGRPAPRDLRRHPLVRHPQEDLQRPLPQHPRGP